MKTTNLFKLFFLTAMLGGSLLMSSCSKDNDVDNRPYTITGDANGSQMVPSTTATGNGTFTGTYDPATRQLTYSSNWSGLTGAPTAARFSMGALGGNGNAVGNAWTLGGSPTGSGTVSAAMTLTEEQGNALVTNGMNYSYGTTANPNGEIRGQLYANR